MGVYHVFISCDSFLVNEEELESFLNKIVKHDGDNAETIKIRCIPKDQNLSNFIRRFNRLEKSSIYVVNVNEELDNISCWELGYAMGRGLEVIGYSGNTNEITICDNFKNIIAVYEDVEEFIGAIEDVFSNLTPKKGLFIGDWDAQRKTAEIERGRL